MIDIGVMLHNFYIYFEFYKNSIIQTILYNVSRSNIVNRTSLQISIKVQFLDTVEVLSNLLCVRDISKCGTIPSLSLTAELYLPGIIIIFRKLSVFSRETYNAFVLFMKEIYHLLGCSKFSASKIDIPCF